ncbi:MAG TPA: hypothetical protein DCW68_02050 [Rhodospirillaceae bacterium]|nr:MAG: hypothetical protein A2018_05015 [Alphaproteobacteria bacterium GWF2_58_20]HAU28877.1 hypothetical protein [Rhodospirillaceae bacterium]
MTGTPQPCPADLLALKSIDAPQGIHRIGNKPEAFRKQLFRFHKHYLNAGSELRRLVSDGDMVASEAYCHTLKGVSGNLSMNSLFSCLCEIDDALKQERMPLPADLDLVDTLLHQVMEEIKTLAPPLMDAAPPSVGAVQDNDIPVKLSVLASLLEKDFGSAEECLADLRTYVAGSELEQAVAKIADQMDVFAIQEALATIHALLIHLDETRKRGKTP